jgi:predicted Zn finger-like uncharacterized protein
MVVGCVNCTTKFVVPDDKVPESGIKVRCSKCQHTFYIKKEKPKRGGPSSVVMIAPDLIDEIQRTKEEGPASGVQLAEGLGASAEASQAPAVSTTPAMSVEEPKVAIEQSPLNVQPAHSTSEEPNTNATQKLSMHTVPKAPRAVAPMPMPKDEDVLELSEEYLPPDWTKRLMVVFLLLLALGLGTGVAAIIRNNFQVPKARDFFYVLLYGPKPKREIPLSQLGEATNSFEAQKNSVEKVITNNGVTIIVVHGEVKNTSREKHGKFHVRATIQNAAGEKIESERPCGTRLDSPWLIGVKSQEEIDALYTEDGRDGMNKAVNAFSSVVCTVVFYAAPDWAEKPTATSFVVTRADGAVVAP